MKKIIAALAVAGALGLAACGGNSTTTVQQAAPAPTTTQTSAEQLLAEAVVQQYAQTHDIASVCAVIDAPGAEAQFTAGYLKGNPQNYPSASLVFDALVTYCGSHV